MRNRSSLLLAALIAVIALSLAASAASALRSIETGGQRSISETSRRLTFEGEGATVICEITLNKTILAAIPKRERSQFGNVEMRAANCERGVLIPLNVAGGWKLLYKSFTGTLPTIRSLRLIIEQMAVLIELFGGLGRCLYKGNAEITTGPNDRVTELIFDSTVAIPLFRNDGLVCAPALVIIGTLRGTTITLRLI